jgi:hypothetical protein
MRKRTGNSRSIWNFGDFSDGFGISKERYIDEILDWNFNFYSFITNLFFSKNAAADRGYLPPACVSDET